VIIPEKATDFLRNETLMRYPLKSPRHKNRVVATSFKGWPGFAGKVQQLATLGQLGPVKSFDFNKRQIGAEIADPRQGV